MGDQAETLFERIRADDRDAVARLLDQDLAWLAARSASGDPPLIAALYAGAWRVVDLLLSRGAVHDVFTASAMGNVVVLPALLDEDPARMHARAHDGWTALHLAAFFGHAAAARLLIDRGADVHAYSTNATRNQPLHAAAVRGQADAVAALLAAGADANARAEGGYTPLQLAAAGGHGAAVDALLAAGADPTRTNDQGLTALALARTRDAGEVVARLEGTAASRTSGQEGT